MDKLKIGQLAKVSVDINTCSKNITRSLDTAPLENVITILLDEFKIIGLYEAISSAQQGRVLLEVGDDYKFGYSCGFYTKISKPNYCKICNELKLIK